MPLSRRIARFNKRVTNRVTIRFAGRLPGFGIVVHTGRRTGQRHRTPVNVFRDGDRFVFALTYGSASDWVQNVLAAGRCELETRGRTYRLVEPRLFTDPSRRAVPSFVRVPLGLLSVDEFLAAKKSAPASPKTYGS